MKITVIGSTSRTGMHLLEQGIRRGHQLVAFSRRPEILENISGLKGIVKGDGRDRLALKRALAGQDAVISIVGDGAIRKTSTIATDVTKAIIEVMREEKISRLVCVSSYLLGSTKPPIVTPFFQWLLRRPLEDRSTADEFVMSSGTNWTIVRPTRLLDSAATGIVRLQTEGREFQSGPFQICRADLATALLDIVENQEDYHSIVNATWGKKNSRPRSVQTY